MRPLIMLAVALFVVFIFTLKRDGASYYDVVCDDVIISYVAYEPTYTRELDVCENY